MTLACAFLGGSGAVRAWQDYRFATVQGRVVSSPFPLTDLPTVLGDGEWRVREGAESTLDPEVAQVAGCTDSLIRTYTNSMTGVNLTVLILFGPAQNVFGHVPEVCYPAAGYQMVEAGLLRGVPIGPGSVAEFRSQVYAREGQKRSRRDEVYYAFRHNDRWTPDPQRYWKEFRHRPSMFKVQVQRPVPVSERREVSNPTEQFLALLIAQIEERIAAAPNGREG